MIEASDRIAVAGAGSIGCYVGGCLALAGRNVVLLGRAPLMEKVTRRGLRISDLDGTDRTLDGASIEAASDAEGALNGARIVLVAVKSGATEAMAAAISQFAPPDAVIVSLQNGMRNAERLRACRPRTVLSAMVPFNWCSIRKAVR